MNMIELSQFRGQARGAQVTLLFGGDFCPIGRYEKRMLAGERIFDDGLAGLWGQHDFSMVNLEAPLCDAGVTADSPTGFGLRADPKIAAGLRGLGIRAVGLANNHARDFGDEGLRQTASHVAAAGLLHTGAGPSLAEAQLPLITEVNGLRLGVWALAERELNAATPSAAGSSWFRPEEDILQIPGLRARCDFLVVYLHAGHEFTTAPSPRIRRVCRGLIEAGADAVIAHHPHVVQGIEKHGNGLIAYSLGNLVFDSPYVAAYKGTDVGYLVRLSAGKHGIHGASIIPYRLTPKTHVVPLRGAEHEAFARRFSALCGCITDDAAFAREWERNVRFRWETEYSRIVTDFSANFHNPANRDFPRRARNLFTCPTHVEMLEQAFRMIEEGKLPRPTPA